MSVSTANNEFGISVCVCVCACHVCMCCPFSFQSFRGLPLLSSQCFAHGLWRRWHLAGSHPADSFGASLSPVWGEQSRGCQGARGLPPSFANKMYNSGKTFFGNEIAQSCEALANCFSSTRQVTSGTAGRATRAGKGDGGQRREGGQGGHSEFTDGQAQPCSQW